MAQTMASFGVCLLILFLAIQAEGAPKKPKKVKCRDKRFPDCYHVKLYCPDSCYRDCVVDCATCQPVCAASPAPIIPPPSGGHSSPPPPKTKPPVHPSPPPPSIMPPPSSSPKRAKCKNRNYSFCYGMELTCPSACPGGCEVDCVTCSPVCHCNRPGAVCQDPRFVGADGIAFYFHGKKDRDFCIVSDSNLHINAHFIGRRNENMKRDFTWVQSLGIRFDNHELFIGAQKTSTWDDSVEHVALEFDREPIILPENEGSQWKSEASRLTITRTHDTNAVEIEVEDNFKIKALVVPITEKESRIHNYGITQEDCFAHLDMSFKFYALSGSVNGVLGQTYASNYVSRAKMGVLMPVLGGDKEFSSSNLFAVDCAVAQFTGQSLEGNSYANFKYANLDCASSSLGGHGVVRGIGEDGEANSRIVKDPNQTEPNRRETTSCGLFFFILR